MLTVRLTQVKNAFSNLLERIANEHFDGEKEILVFHVNNLDYIY